MTRVDLSFESGESTLRARRVEIREAMSACFRAKVLAVSPDSDLDLDALVGGRVTIALTNTARRVLRGVCLAVDHVRVEVDGQSAYELEIGPPLALLEYRTRHRLFQHESAPDIALRVLGEWAIVAAARIDRGRYPKLEFRVQHGETDLAFVSRILEEAGISYTFPTEDAEGAPDIVLEDASHTADPAFVATHVENPDEQRTRLVVTRVRVGRRLKETRVVLRDRHFRVAPTATLAGEAGAPSHASPRPGSLERARYAHGASVIEAASPQGDTPVADAHSPARPDTKQLERLATDALARERGAGREVFFETNIDALRPGLCLRIEGHPRDEVGRGPLLVTDVQTSIQIDGIVRIEARARFTDQPLRPALATPKPRALGVHPAMVVGPAGEEIHTDEFGRVLVQLGWDHDHGFEQASSCWLRVSQGWAGAGHASFTLPRVGDEVLVGFFDGDPDHPVVVGRLHSATSPVPYRLPGSKTVSTWRSASVPATGGYNEISFDDAAGSELVHVQAERDLHKLVKNVETIEVGASRHAKIGTTDDALVGERHTITIGGDGADATSAAQRVTQIAATPSRIVLTTGEARIVLDGPDIHIDAPGEIVLRAVGLLRVESSQGDVVVQGGPIVRINPRGGGEHPDGTYGQIPFDLGDGESASDVEELVASYAERGFHDPEEPNHLDAAMSLGGALDPAPRGQRDDGLRAFKFAVAGRAVGMPEGVLVRRAGMLNRAANGPAAGAGDPGNGVFGGEAPYGTTPAQLSAIREGFSYFDRSDSQS